MHPGIYLERNVWTHIGRYDFECFPNVTVVQSIAATEVISKLDGDAVLETVTEYDIRDLIMNRMELEKGVRNKELDLLAEYVHVPKETERDVEE